MPGDFLRQRRGDAGAVNLGDQGREAKKASQGEGRERILGQYSKWYPDKEKAMWLAISPHQRWTFDFYNRSTSQVETWKDRLYYAYINHRVAGSFADFPCSAGAHRDQPCWGCGVYNKHQDWAYAYKREHGQKPEKKPAIGYSPQFVWSCVLLEHIAKIKKVSARGTQYFQERALPLLDKSEGLRLKEAGETTFGMPVWWGTNISQRDTLIDFDDVLVNSCASCARDLKAEKMACPECGEWSDPPPSNDITEDLETGGALTKDRLMEARKTDIKCGVCGYYGKMYPVIQCDCGKPVEGQLLDFALRLVSRKLNDTQTVLAFTKILPISYFTQKYPVIDEYLKKPLQLDKLFAPKGLEYQKKLIPPNLRGDGVSPEPRRRFDADAVEPAAKEYTFGRTGTDDGPDQEDDDIPF